jgi:hypothetical protein
MRKKTILICSLILVISLVLVFGGVALHRYQNVTVTFEDQIYDAKSHTITGQITGFNRKMNQLRLVLFSSDDGQTWEKITTLEPDADGRYVFVLDQATWFLAAKQQLILYAVRQEEIDAPYEEMKPWGSKSFSLPTLPSLADVTFNEEEGLLEGSVIGDISQDAYVILAFGKNGTGGWFPFAAPTELTGNSFSIALTLSDWVIATEKDYTVCLVKASLVEIDNEMASYDQVKEYVMAETRGVVPMRPVPTSSQSETVPPQPDPIPAEPEPIPVEPDPVPVEPDPIPAEPDPVPVEPDPAPVEPDPIPAEPNPVPVEPDPIPVEPDPIPAEPDPVPVEPSFDTASIAYNESSNSISGRVVGDISGCYVVLYIQVAGEYWVKPTYAEALTSIDSTGAFRMNAYSTWPSTARAGDLTATAYILYLVEGEPSIGLHNYTGTYLDIFEGTR